MDVHAAIRSKFRIKRHDNLPYTGWAGTRQQLAELLGELGLNKGAEIGVYDGAYSEVLCKANPNIELLCIDPWTKFRGHNQEKMDSIYKAAVDRLSGFNATLIKKTSLEAAQGIPDRFLDFVYIDGLHEFNAVMQDLIAWTPKVKKGGIVAGHDFWHYNQSGVVFAVEAFTRGNNIKPWYLAHRDRIPSWVWVN